MLPFTVLCTGLHVFWLYIGLCVDIGCMLWAACVFCKGLHVFICIGLYASQYVCIMYRAAYVFVFRLHV
jgi:hypothetical protein